MQLENYFAIMWMFGKNAILFRVVYLSPHMMLNPVKTATKCDASRKIKLMGLLEHLEACPMKDLDLL